MEAEGYVTKTEVAKQSVHNSKNHGKKKEALRCGTLSLNDGFVETLDLF